MNGLYEDQWIRCDVTTLTIRGYYFPWGSKVIAYRDIQDVTPIEIGIWTGKWRIWGTSDFRYWWHLDPSRPQKDTALILDIGRPVKPIITPDDPARVAASIEERRRPLS